MTIYDVIVVGAGAAGLMAAGQAAQMGAHFIKGYQSLVRIAQPKFGFSIVVWRIVHGW